MKIFTIIIVSLALVFSSEAQNDCIPYVPTKEGAKWEITNYTAKGKENGKVAYELAEKIETADGITFTIKTSTYDKKGDEVFSSQYEAHCKNGKFEFDMAYKMDGGAMQAYESMDVEVDASEFEIPDMNAAPGTALKDGSLHVSVGASGAALINMKVNITDRKVEAREDIETPAGTFNCLKVSQKVSTKTIVKVEGSSKEWYAENVGMVRSETYSKKGKLTGFSELTKLEQ